MSQFFRIVLRTDDVASARSFYASVLGREVDHIVPLHAQAIARGARPHWLGLLEVADVASAAADFIASGAVALGPTWVNPEGIEAAIVRDPGGAIVALAKPPAGADTGASTHVASPSVAWHALNTADVARAKANYARLAGWRFEAPIDLGEHGLAHPFVWANASAPAGSLSDIAGRPGVHPHWLFHFEVAAIDPAAAAVRAAGCKVIGPTTLPNQCRVAVCEDPQGAAFALFEDVRARS